MFAMLLFRSVSSHDTILYAPRFVRFAHVHYIMSAFLRHILLSSILISAFFQWMVLFELFLCSTATAPLLRWLIALFNKVAINHTIH